TPSDPVAFPEAPRVRALAHGGGCLYAGVAGAKGEGGAVYGRAGARPSQMWKRLTPIELSIGQIKDVAVEGDRILVTARNEYRDRTFRAGGAWLSTDAGATWRKVFSDKFCESALISSGELFVSLADHPYHDHSVGGGVVHSRDDGATWTHLDGPGLQNWNVSALAVDPFDKQTLWLGTGGNSVFVGHLP
ncbi:MAG: exo-alpha-sialidase, partial [Kiritimatiellae bacterium]|nr:exo-alpha-sialidase [Kiritimatiellia bacterium]